MIIASRPSCPEGWLPTLIQPVIQLVSLIYDGTTKAAGQLGIKILICKFHICYFKKYLRTRKTSVSKLTLLLILSTFL